MFCVCAANTPQLTCVCPPAGVACCLGPAVTAGGSWRAGRWSRLSAPGHRHRVNCELPSPGSWPVAQVQARPHPLPCGQLQPPLSRRSGLSWGVAVGGGGESPLWARSPGCTLLPRLRPPKGGWGHGQLPGPLDPKLRARWEVKAEVQPISQRMNKGNRRSNSDLFSSTASQLALC